MASGQNVCLTQAEPLGRCRQHSRQMTGPGCFSEHLVKLHRANIGPVTNTCHRTRARPHQAEDARRKLRRRAIRFL